MSAEVELFTTSILGNPVTRSRHDRYVTVLSALEIPFVYHDLASDDDAKRRWRRRARDPRIPGLLVRDEWVGTFEEFEEAVELSQVREFVKVDAVAEPQFSKRESTSSDNKTQTASLPPAPTLMATPAQPTPSTRDLDADQMLSELLPPSSKVSDAEVDALLKELEKPLQRTPRRVFTPTARSSSNTEPKSLKNQAPSQHARYNPEQRNLVQEAARAIGVDPTPRGPAPRVKLNNRPLQEILAERRSRQARTESVRKNDELFTSLGLNDTAIKDEDVEALLGESKSTLPTTNASSSSSKQSQQPAPKAEPTKRAPSAINSATEADDMTGDKLSSDSIAGEQQVSAQASQVQDSQDEYHETSKGVHKPTSPSMKDEGSTEPVHTVSDSQTESIETQDVHDEKSQTEAVQSSDTNIINSDHKKSPAQANSVEDTQSKDAQIQNLQSKDAQSEKLDTDSLQVNDVQRKDAELEEAQPENLEVQRSQSKDTPSRDAKSKDAESEDTKSIDAHLKDTSIKDEQVASPHHKSSQSAGLQSDSLSTKDAQDEEAHKEDLETGNTETEKLGLNDPHNEVTHVTDPQIANALNEDSKTWDSPIENRKSEDSYTEESHTQGSYTEKPHTEDSLTEELQAKETQPDLQSHNIQSEESQSGKSQSEDLHAKNLQSAGSLSDNLQSTSSQADFSQTIPTMKQSPGRTSLKDRLRNAVHKDESDASFPPSSISSMQPHMPSTPDRSHEKVQPLSTEGTEIGLGTPEKGSNSDLQTADAETNETAKTRENENETQTVIDVQNEPTNEIHMEESGLDVAESPQKLNADSSAEKDSLDKSNQASQSLATGDNYSEDNVHSLHNSQASKPPQAYDSIETPTTQPTNDTSRIASTPSKNDSSQSEAQAGISPVLQATDSKPESVKQDKQAIQSSQSETMNAATQITGQEADNEAMPSSDEASKGKLTDELTADLHNLSVVDSSSDPSQFHTEPSSGMDLDNESPSAVSNADSKQANPSVLDTAQHMSAAPTEQLDSTQSKQTDSSDALAQKSLPQVIQQQSQQEAKPSLEPQDKPTLNTDKRQSSPPAHSRNTETLAVSDSGEIDTLAETDNGKTGSQSRAFSSSSQRAEETPTRSHSHTRSVQSTAHPHVHWESQIDMDEAVLAHPKDPISKPVNDTATIEHLPLPDEHAQNELRRIRRSDSLKHGIRYLGAGASEESQRVALHQTLDRFSSLEEPILQEPRSEAAQEALPADLSRRNTDESALPNNPTEEQQRIAQHQVLDRFSALEPALQLGTTSPSDDLQDEGTSFSSRQSKPFAEDLPRAQSSSQSSSVLSAVDPGMEQHQPPARTGLDQDSITKSAESHRIAEHQVLDRFSALERPLDLTGNQEVAPKSPDSRLDPTRNEQTSLASSTAEPAVKLSDQEIDHGTETNLTSSHEDDTSDDLERDQVPDLWVSESAKHPQFPTHRSGLESDWDSQASDLSSSSDEPLRPPVGSSPRNTSQVAEKPSPLRNNHTSQVSERTQTNQPASSTLADESDLDASQTHMLTEEQSDEKQHPADLHPSPSSPPIKQSVSSTLPDEPSQDAPADRDASHSEKISATTVTSASSPLRLVPKADPNSTSDENQLDQTKGSSGADLDLTAESSKQSSVPGSGVPGADSPGAGLRRVAMPGNHPRAPTTTATNQSEVGRRAVSGVNPAQTANDSARSASTTQREGGHRKTLSAIMKEADAFLQEWTQDK
ncbi:hypothetical protein MYAM1_001833 [Malassezia yamatoensis]|uniref:Uncharacterized protein n=1 Tax=Malassezia yamatoensis TaxID=253288 RepID=A0AAJ5YTN4_9BASI|nr:hypothetical protein MYAM1_001833 [Malassezia yamatoensis]